MRIERTMYVDSVSSSAVQLRRVPGLTTIPDADPGSSLHQVNIVTGVNTATNANTAVFAAGCNRLWRVILESVS